LKILATSWGFSGSVDAFCTKVKKGRLRRDRDVVARGEDFTR
jgi:hypothetical protein